MKHVVEAGVEEHKPKPVGRPKIVKTPDQKRAQAAKATIRNRLNKKKSRKLIREKELEAGIVKKRGRPPKIVRTGIHRPDSSC